MDVGARAREVAEVYLEEEMEEEEDGSRWSFELAFDAPGLEEDGEPAEPAEALEVSTGRAAGVRFERVDEP